MTNGPDGSRGPRNDEWTIGDFLDRRALVQAAAMAAATWRSPLTVGIYGPWGEGKTSTMRMIQGALDPDVIDSWGEGHGRDEGPPLELPREARANVRGTVWFDPWRYQFENTPASSLVRTIVQTAERRGWVKPESSTACGFLKRVGMWVAEGAIRTASTGQAGVSDVVGSIATALGPEALEKSFAELFQEKYRQAVGEILAEKPNGRLVVFLDDLDRCQGEYVVRMLEALKLTLLDPRCVYIVGIDDGVVASAVRDHYRRRFEDGGAGVDPFSGERYLEKIVQLPIRLPGLMDELADEFIRRLVPPGAALAAVREDDPAQWETIAETLRVGLRRNPRQAKRFIMLIEFTLSLAKVKLDRAEEEGQTLPVENVDAPLLVKLQLIQFSWPHVPRSGAVLKELERLSCPPERKGGAEPGAEALAPDALRQRFQRCGVADPAGQERLEQFLRETEPKFLDIKEDKVLDFHVHLAAATAGKERRAPEEVPELEPIPPRGFSAEIEEDDEGAAIVLNGQVRLPLVRIEAGTFRMGSPEDDDMASAGEKPLHEVEITQAFYLGASPVTQKQWGQAMARNPSRFTEDGAERPVESVSWHDARSFCAAVSRATGQDVRLPTEAEWEYACRAGRRARFWYGDDPNELGKHAWFAGNSEGGTRPVGAEGHQNPWGACDMAGNVWEWCSDWYGEYANARVVDPAGPTSGPGRVVRGGSWGVGPRSCRSAFRGRGGAEFRPYGFGFRVVVAARGLPE